MAKLRLDDKTVRALTAPAAGNRIDYDVPKGPRDTDFVRGFAVRTTAAGTRTFLLCYVTKEGRERRHKIGDFGPHTVTTARDAARRLRVAVDGGADPFATTKTDRAAAEALRTRERASFGDLLLAYVKHLERGKKASSAKVQSELERTVKVPFPALWKAPAISITLDDLVRILSKLTKRELWRQAQKTRSYLRAAYTAAVGSRGDAATADLFTEFTTLQNVARDLATIVRPQKDVGSDDDEKRALSVEELRAYWRRIRDKPNPHGAALRFHLLTGAQRCEQLARLTMRSLDRDVGAVTVLDRKGRRTKPREHVVPLVPDATKAIDAMVGDSGPHLFTIDAGATGVSYHSVRKLIADIASEMVAAKETASTFTPGELRISVETRLAAAGVSKETRAQLQSHGLGGVQDRHYDKHKYFAEKRAALQTLCDLLDPPKKSKIVKFPAKKAG